MRLLSNHYPLNNFLNLEFVSNAVKTAKTVISNLEKFSPTQAASDELVNAGQALDNFQNKILKVKVFNKLFSLG